MKKVITYGTFDLFHKGHYNILKRAKDLGDYLIVGVTSESYDLERGKLNVRDSLIKRIENVRATGLADEIIIEEYQGQKIHDIIRYQADIFVVGSDWRGKFDYLKEYCQVHYLERTKNISSTQLREQEKIYSIGIITDRLDDNSIVLETKYISGLNVEKVFARDEEMARTFCQQYELYTHCSDLETFFDGLDVVYINTAFGDRAYYVDAAIKHKKYVICPAPIVKDTDQLKAYIDEAHKQGVLIIDNILVAYLRAFTQLIWMLKGNIIGDILRVHCNMSMDSYTSSKDIPEVLTCPLFVCMRILGMDYNKIDKQDLYDSENNLILKKINLKYENALADIDLSCRYKMRNEITIYGSKGHVIIPDEWWNMGYFECRYENGTKQRFSYNFEGTGMRYLLQEAIIMINDKRKMATRVFANEVIRLVEILNKIQ